MERDFRKLTAWIEEILQEVVPVERKLLEWKLLKKSREEKLPSDAAEQSKAS